MRNGEGCDEAGTGARPSAAIEKSTGGSGKRRGVRVPTLALKNSEGFILDYPLNFHICPIY